MPHKALNSDTDLVIRYDATLQHLRRCMADYEKEAANLTAAKSTELQTQRYQTALRGMLEALIEHAREIAKLEPQLKRPN
jgi:hypothetical protein